MHSVIPASHATLSSLPLEVLPKILISFDPGTISLVCKCWHQMIPQLCKMQLNEKQSLTIAEIFNYNRRLVAKLEDWDSVLQHCENLKMLDLSYDFDEPINGYPAGEWLRQEKMRRTIIGALREKCKGIKILDLANVREGISDGAQSDIAEKLSELTHLRLKHCTLLLPGLKTLSQNCKNLISLDFLGSFIHSNSVFTFTQQCTKLRKLNLHNCVYSSQGAFLSHEHLTNDSITALAEKCPELTHLAISVRSITATGLRALMTHCQKLQYLQLSACTEELKKVLNSPEGQIPLALRISIIGPKDDPYDFWLEDVSLT